MRQGSRMQISRKKSTHYSKSFIKKQHLHVLCKRTNELFVLNVVASKLLRIRLIRSHCPLKMKLSAEKISSVISEYEQRQTRLRQLWHR